VDVFLLLEAPRCYGRPGGRGDLWLLRLLAVEL